MPTSSLPIAPIVHGAAALPLWLSIVLAALLIIGSLAVFIGALGQADFRSFYDRLHMTGPGNTIGAAAILLAGAVYASYQGRSLQFRFALILIFLTIAAPIVLMMLARAAAMRDFAQGKFGESESGKTRDIFARADESRAADVTDAAEAENPASASAAADEQTNATKTKPRKPAKSAAAKRKTKISAPQNRAPADNVSENGKTESAVRPKTNTEAEAEAEIERALEIALAPASETASAAESETVGETVNETMGAAAMEEPHPAALLLRSSESDNAPAKKTRKPAAPKKKAPAKKTAKRKPATAKTAKTKSRTEKPKTATPRKKSASTKTDKPKSEPAG